MWADLGGGGQLAKPPSEKISHCFILSLYFVLYTINL